MDERFRELPVGKGEVIKRGDDLAIIAIGSAVAPSMEAAGLLSNQGVNCTIVNARYAKPLDCDLILELARGTKRLVTVEDNVLVGGFGSAILSLLSNATDTRVLRIGIPDEFVEHGPQGLIRANYGLNGEGIAHRILSFFPELAHLSPTTKIKQ
jgi:1-deoxy-D-xylulose-5-phosphate synthase